ncbi:MAG: UDP-N-acetylmuramoyl-tripeptide--D-alanyl-D-alanine ligase [Planctomycetota bacterium]
MSFWSYANLSEVTKGRWLVEPADLTAEVAGLWHDTREIKEGQAYLAIKGENFDGHDFIDKAFDAGAALAIVSTPSLTGVAGDKLASPRNEALGVTDQTTRSGGSPSLHPGHPVLLVPDTVKSLQDLARVYRDELKAGGCKVIGIAGSNGKTTTRHLIHHVLTHAGLEGTQSPKSFNNHLGVPLTLLSAKPEHDFVACEIGTNHPGEIAFLSEIARPDIAVITSIGLEHLEFFKDLAGVAKEEAAILTHISPGGDAVVCQELREDAGDQIAAARMRYNVHQFGYDADYNSGFVIDYDEDEHCQLFTVHGPLLRDSTTHLMGPGIEEFGTLIRLRMNGTHNVNNAMAGMIVARLLGVETVLIQEALRTIEPIEGRMQKLRFGQGISVIHDAYNANPTSMSFAVSEALGFRDKRRVLILGDMLELGELSEPEHRELGESLGKYAPMNRELPVTEFSKASDGFWESTFGAKISNDELQLGLLILIGPEMSAAFNAVRKTWPPSRIHYYADWQDGLDQNIAALLQPGDTVLLKASRGMRLERLIPAIERRFGPAQGNEPT